MGEKKRRLSALPPGQAHFDGRILARALEAVESGDRASAAAAFEVLQANLPRDADALNAIGVLALQLGDPGRAAGAAAPRDRAEPAAAGVSLSSGDSLPAVSAKPDLAVAELEAALALDPTLAEAHSNLGNLLLERGDNAAAEASFAPRARASARLSVRAVRSRRSEARAGALRGGLRGFRAGAGARPCVPRGPVRPVARPLGDGGRAGSGAADAAIRFACGRGQRGHRAGKHRGRAAAVARQSGVLDAVRALRQGIRSAASGRSARPRSAVPRARPRRGRPGAPGATDREPRGHPSRGRRIAASPSAAPGPPTSTRGRS